MQRLLDPVAPRRPARRRGAQRACHREHVVDLDIGLNELNGSWNTPWTVAVVGAQRVALEPGDVGPLVGDAALGDRDQAQDHLADGRLAAAALADQRHDLAGCDREVGLAHGEEPAAAEGTDAIDLGPRSRVSIRSDLPARDGMAVVDLLNGGCSTHCASASGQRARNRQPVGGLSSDGGVPGCPPAAARRTGRPSRAATRSASSCTGGGAAP